MSTRITNLVLAVGDSLIGGFNNRLVTREGHPSLLFRAHYVFGAMLDRPESPTGAAFGLQLERALAAAQYVGEYDGRMVGTHDLLQGGVWTAVARAFDNLEPFIVLGFGAHEFVRFLRTLPGSDFPASETALERWPSTAADAPLRPGAIELAQARHFVWFHLRPLRLAIVQLRNAGFTRIALLPVPPMNVDDRMFALAIGAIGGAADRARDGAPFRYKLAALINELIAEFARDEAVTFIDTWPLLSDNGFRRPDHLAEDLIHLSDAANAQLVDGPIADAVYAALRERAARPARDGSEPPYRPGDWLVHEGIADAALFTGTVFGADEAYGVHRPALGLADRWPANRVRLASDDEVEAARSGAAVVALR